MSMGGEGHVEVEYKAGKFVPLSNEKINTMKKDSFYADIFRDLLHERGMLSRSP